ncbi:hypothetical protein BFW01_g4345 [Lasiodiplodia theobromae]|uniref:AB hydrolase-1 domain-containing protein n=1 Tax=Lasiodiplodia theobromae TaxID=45133 RepID=A0A5N5D163_9PEZI|nr:Alpha beta-hydrolase [Lasiodiplodia theobromae]KAB2571331.1 hypothetical protein DBV05_g10020 [Lasiodiplodia theobromae]KAF4539165.1 Alpha beta-hydrolase [Lasiodiplodia theobromae]KAF9633451.1 hypothetical protein BFW01_g4345 [Lasiodiplodia theobromae]
MVGKAAATGLALISVASAAKQCLNQTVPVDIESRNAVFDTNTIPHSNIDVTWFIQNMTRQGHNFTDEALTGYNTIRGTYNLSTQYCWDDQTTSDKPTLQILTHGIGFDKTYWDLSFHDFNYSYVNAALDAGFATLSYDRLGIGQSQHGDPLNEIQTNIEVAALRALTEQVRNGSFPNVNTTYDSVVHVGHSYGSIQSYILAARYPSLTNGLVLTGFALNSSFNAFFLAGGNFQQASINAPLRFGSPSLAATVEDFLFESSPLYDWVSPIDLTALPAPQDLPDGYITPANSGANQYQFLLPPFFDVDILALAERTKQPVAVGELLTLASAPAQNNFDGPVLVFTGDADLPFCGGDCLETGGAAPSIPAQVQRSFPNVASEDFLAYIQPNTGHGLTTHYNATAGYHVISDWLRDHGF